MAESNRQKHSDHFKADAVHLTLETKRQIAAIAGDAEANESAVRDWVSQWCRDNQEPVLSPKLTALSCSKVV